jgi:RHS repeat-associated protein
LSNESNEPVYFDDFKVADTRGRIIEEDHYYAFGLRIDGISSKKLDVGIEGSLKNNNLYNDKELWDDADLNWYDYGFRNYDPQIGRFTQLDPLTDDYPELTPYQYASDEPIANVDIDGLEKLSAVSDFTYSYSKTISNFAPIVSDATHIAHLSPLLKLSTTIPQVAKTAGNLTNRKINNSFKRPAMRVGFDWQGKGALPLPEKLPTQSKKDNFEYTFDLSSNIAETGDYVSRLSGNFNLANKFGFASNAITGISLINNLANGNSAGARMDLLDLGISKTPLAPYYYSYKILKFSFTNDFVMENAQSDALNMRNKLYYQGVLFDRAGNHEEAQKKYDEAVLYERIAKKISHNLQKK